MQRIDENTYIDDTLVTCAEYQLFIDEMYNCQPDHWASYRFTKGQAHAPILGMRYSDAVAFYKWLTLREANNWRYRLPTKVEATEYPLKSNRTPLPLGYWIMDTDNQFRFAWAYPISVNPRGINRNKLTRELARNLDFAFDLDISHARNLDLALNLALDLDLNFNMVRARTFDRELARELSRYLDRALDLTRNRARSLTHHDLDHDRALDLDRALYLVGGIALKHILNINLSSKRDFAINFTLDLFIDIFTLQERVTGRSPAFEGIRLVKERIR